MLPPYANRMEGIQGSVVRALAKLLANPEIISFGGGNPANDSFPVDVVDAICQDLLKSKGRQLLQYGITEGYEPLRESYLEYVAAPKGIQATPDNVLIMTGAMQGLDLMCKLFINPGDVIMVENPTFAGALQAFRIAQAKLVPVSMDEDGVILDEFEEKIKEHKPKLFYCIPTFQNPSGRTLSLARRKKIVELAQKYNFIVFEDDPYCDLRFRGEELPPMKTFDETGNVALFHSFSKILSPGLRVGAMVTTAEIVDKAGICKQCSDTHTANLNQAIADQFLRQNYLKPHLEKIIPPYRVKMETMIASVEKHFPAGTLCTKPDGGLFVWIELPKEINMPEYHKRSINEAKVAFVPGMAFCVNNPSMGKRSLRFNFSNASPERIDVGVARLAELLKEYM